MIAALIQARLGSTRLPGKVLMDIEGKPMLQRVIERVEQSKLINMILVVTPNLNIVEICRILGISGCIGPEKDVLARYLFAARDFDIDIIVRVTADCPLIDPEIIDKTIKYYLNNSYDYVSNTGTYPDGLDTEVFSSRTLQKAYEGATEPYDREHVTPYMVKNFKAGKLESGQDYSKHKWSVDTIADLELVRRIYNELDDKFNFEDILERIKNGFQSRQEE